MYFQTTTTLPTIQTAKHSQALSEAKNLTGGSRIFAATLLITAVNRNQLK
jgi:hypothetical protein